MSPSPDESPAVTRSDDQAGSANPDDHGEQPGLVALGLGAGRLDLQSQGQGVVVDAMGPHSVPSASSTTTTERRRCRSTPT